MVEWSLYICVVRGGPRCSQGCCIIPLITPAAQCPPVQCAWPTCSEQYPGLERIRVKNGKEDRALLTWVPGYHSFHSALCRIHHSPPEDTINVSISPAASEPETAFVWRVCCERGCPGCEGATSTERTPTVPGAAPRCFWTPDHL